MAKSTSKTKKQPSSKLASAVIQKDSEAIAYAPVDQNDSGTGLEDLFLDAIKDIYWAENHLVKSIPKMQKAAGAESLKNAFSDHLEVTKEHVSRLEQVFKLLGKKVQAKKCDAMEGLSMEGEGIIEDTDAGSAARDAGLIMAAQKVEHYEIATYGGLAKLAQNLGKDEIANLLEQTLSEEKEADALLTGIAENDIDYSSDNKEEKE
jgi:ferritin-like metal-binding protein YciE